MSDCTTNPNGTSCPEPSSWDSTCRPWDISTDTRLDCYADSLIQEALDIAGAPINIYKLLGVHEQTKLVDLIGNGNPISGGDAINFPAVNAFNTLNIEWRSKQTQIASILASSYIGYDFGEVKLLNGRQRYGIEASIRQHVTAIKIKQSSNPLARVSKLRVERSENGTEWYGVAIVSLPPDDQLNTIHFKHSVPSRFWRLRPIQFVGTNCIGWGIQALEMYDYSVTHISNIQDKILLENRNRDYQDSAIMIKGYYDLVNVSTELSRFGIEIPMSTYQIKVNFNAVVAKLGRPVVIGDILELPSETQYTSSLTPVKRYLEVSDVTWDANTYTPGWQPTMLLVTAMPALASEETQDIFGDLAKHVDSSGLFSTDDGNNAVYQDYSNVDQTVKADALTAVPERGSEGSNTIREFEQEELETAAQEGFPHLSKLGLNRTGLYVEDAIPQNGASYTEGPDFPISPKNGDYHRMTYLGLSKDLPARLFRWSSVKGRWIFLEKDRRSEFNGQKAALEEYTRLPSKTFAREIK